MDDGGYSQRVLENILSESSLDRRDRGWVTATVNGVLSDLRAIDLALDRALDRGFGALFGAPLAHMRIGTWEIGRQGREPGPIVNAAVNAVRDDAPRRFTGLVNGVLRTVARDKAILFNPPKKADETTRFAIEHGLPDWIATRLHASGGDPVAVMDAWNESVPTAFRVRQGTRADVIAELTEAGIECRPHPLVANCGLAIRGHLAATPAHQERRISITDAGAQLAIAALPALPSGPVIDVCAGIGGKTLALADRYPNAALAASDQNPKKLDVLQRSLGKREVDAKFWELGKGDSPFDAEGFSIVVVDAPCSALGTIGRHPEVRWNREPEVVETMAALQRRILSDAAALVMPGGTLLYIVCTWTEEETSQVVGDFLSARPDFALSPPSATTADPDVDWGAVIDDRGTATLWPHTSASDGFFFARFTRTS